MIPFCFNPSTNRESLKSFNDRVSEYCLDQGAVQIVPQAFGQYLILNVWTEEDLDDVPPGTPTLTASVLQLNSKDGDVEEQMEKLQEREASKATDSDPVREPSNVVVLANPANPMTGWAICITVTGELMMEEVPQSDEERKEEEEQEQPGIPTFTPDVIPPDKR